MHTPTPYEWAEYATIARRLSGLLNTTDFGDDPRRADVRIAALDLAEGLAKVAASSKKAERDELRAEKRDDRHREEAAELTEMIGATR